MKLSRTKIRRIGKQRGLTVSRLLERSGVSRTAFYSLARRKSVLPKTIHSIARTLGVTPLEVLELASQESRLERARRIVAANPGADFQNVWHTLTLLELPPADRLDRSLLRGRPRDLHV